MKGSTRIEITTAWAALLIGVISLVTIAFYNYRVQLKYEELGGLSEIITLFTYSSVVEISLYLSQILGLTLGILSLIKFKKRIDLFASVLCSCNLCFLILGWPFAF